MPDIYMLRKENLRLLLQDRSATGIAAACGYQGPSYVSQMAGKNATRPITEVTARKMERALGLPELWLDQPRDSFGAPAAPAGKSHPPVVHEPIGSLVDPEQFLRCVEVAHAAAARAGITLTADKKSRLVHLLYEELPADDATLQKFADSVTALMV